MIYQYIYIGGGLRAEARTGELTPTDKPANRPTDKNRNTNKTHTQTVSQAVIRAGGSYL